MENQIIKGMFFILRDKQKLEYMLDKNFVKLKHNYAYFNSEIDYPPNYL